VGLCSTTSQLCVDERRPIHLVRSPPRKPHNAPARLRSPRHTLARLRPGAHRAARAGLDFHVKQPRAVVVLGLAHRPADQGLPLVQRQRRRSSARSAVRKRLPGGQGQRQAIEPLRATKRDRLRLWRSNGSKRSHVVVKVAMRATVRLRHPELIIKTPLEVHQNGIVVAQHVPIRLEKHIPRVLERSGLKIERGGAAVPHLVDNLAVRGVGGVVAEGFCGGDDAAAGKLDPGVFHAVVGDEDGRDVGGARVARVGVAEDENGVSG
jgi:hypothetical protein